MADGGVWTKVYPASSSNAVSPGRNLLYNGAMQVAQRSTSKTGITASGYYTADRWLLTNSTLGTWTQTIEDDAPTGSGFGKSLKMLCTTADSSPAAGDHLWIQQLLEGFDVQRLCKGTSSAHQVTASFWVKSNVTGTYVASLLDNNNTRIVSATYSISASATWEKKTITFPADTTGSLDNNNSVSLRIIFGLATGSDYSSGTLNTSWDSTVTANRLVGQTNLAAAAGNYWQVTGVQLEVGETATEFEHKKFGAELAECQRYYEKSYNQGVDPGTAAIIEGCWSMVGAVNSGAITGNWTIPFAVVKRAKPTFTYYSPETGASGYISNRAGAFEGDKNTGLSANAAMSSVRTSIGSGVGIGNYLPDDSSWIRAQWTAEAEL